MTKHIHAERDARIAELERQLENEKQHSKHMTQDRDLWRLTASERGHQLAEARSQVAEECAKVCDELKAPASCVGVEKSLWDVATMAAGDAILERFKAKP